MKKGTKLFELGVAAERLYKYLEKLENPDEAKRDAIMHMVHELNAAYIEWGFDLDVEYLRAPRDIQLDMVAELE